jgi:nitroreductase
MTHMDAIDALCTRTSVGALTDPPPPPEILDLAMQCALAAPDHGRQKPARFIVVEGEARQKLGQMFAESLRRKRPNAPPEQLDREAKKPLRAPVIIIAVCLPQEGKIPEIEQILSVGAAVENVLLALHANGYGAIWRTGDAAYDNELKHELGLSADDHIIAFIYAGTPVSAPRPIQRVVSPNAVRRL